MRITSAAITRNMLSNVNKNAGKLNSLYTQMSSGKSFLYPSENPVGAAKIIQLRSTIAVEEQYLQNTYESEFFMETIELSISNCNSILQRVGDLSVQGSSDTLTIEDREKIIQEIESLKEQFMYEMNTSYNGRNIFSGFRTDVNSSYKSDTDERFEINQNFTQNDIKERLIYHKPSTTAVGKEVKAYVIEMPYEDIDKVNSFKINGVSHTLTEANSGDVGAYEVGKNEIKFLKDTGEFVFGEDIKNVQDDSIEVVYEKDGFLKSEINPRVYFECKLLAGTGDPADDISYSFKDDAIEFSIGRGVTLKTNTLSRDVITTEMVGTFNKLINNIEGATVSTRAHLEDFYESKGLSGEDLENAIEEHLRSESDSVRNVSHQSFDTFIGEIDEFMESIRTQHTDIGTRISRSNIMQERIEGQLLNFRELLVETEGVDYAEVIMNLQSAESVYQASINIGAKIMQISVLDYI